MSVTTELAWYTLTVPEGVVSTTTSAAVECAYAGPATQGISWSVDDKEVRVLFILLGMLSSPPDSFDLS